ncbi:hypothetical protein AYI70_g4967 [Smittium culicis]|uniref:Survival Motor Neuron Gemin2-binding domain-containing protein n=1 Tax=Smittium culicis TaxID=133412 RepID=A0A1R1XWL3_9FUNG|nr:hypothetical protein AYI70_g4967 [Smittium culicis]
MSGNAYKPDGFSNEDIEYDKEFDSYGQEVSGYDCQYYETDVYGDFNNAESFDLEQDYEQETECIENIQDYKNLNFTNRNLWDDSMLISAWDNSIKDYKEFHASNVVPENTNLDYTLYSEKSININKNKKRKSKNLSQNNTIGFESELKNINCEIGVTVAQEKKVSENIKLDNTSNEKAQIESPIGATTAEPAKSLQGCNMTTTKGCNYSDNNYDDEIDIGKQSFTEYFVHNKQPKPPKPKNKKQLIEYLCNSNYYLGYYMGLLEWRIRVKVW